MAATRAPYHARRTGVLTEDSPKPPDAVYGRQRYIARERIEWLEECDRIMMQHGTVQGSKHYEIQHHARWRVDSLISLMVELGIHERWQVKRHVQRHPDGTFTWSLEYVGHDGTGRQHV